MAKPNYRVVLSFDNERKVFMARIPEMPHVSGEGATRSEAIAQCENELDALLQNLAERGNRPPAAIDENEYSGELAVKVSRGLHRDLEWQAHLEGVPLAQLVAELLSGGLEGRQRGRQRRAGFGGGPNELPAASPGNEGGRPPQRGYEGEGRWRSGGHAARSQHLLDDRANFIEYVRGLESEAGRGHGHGPGPHRDNRGGERRYDNQGGRGPDGNRGGERRYDNQGGHGHPRGDNRRGPGGRGRGGPPNQRNQSQDDRQPREPREAASPPAAPPSGGESSEK